MRERTQTHPEPYNLGINYNFNFTTIKAMTSFLKEKHETPKIWITSRVSVLSWAQLLHLHITSIVLGDLQIIWCGFLGQSRSSNVKNVQPRNNNTDHSFFFFQKGCFFLSPTLSCMLPPRQLSASLFRNNRPLMCPCTCSQRPLAVGLKSYFNSYCILNNCHLTEGLPRVKKPLTTSCKLIVLSWAAAAIVLGLIGLTFTDPLPGKQFCGILRGLGSMLLASHVLVLHFTLKQQRKKRVNVFCTLGNLTWTQEWSLWDTLPFYWSGKI